MPLFAAVHVAEAPGSSPETLARDGHALATRLSQQPGFVSYLVVLAADGTVVSIHIHEDAATLADADRLAATWAGTEAIGAAARTERGPVITGEIIVQKGL